MKKRILTAIVGIAFFIMILFFSDGFVLNAAISILSAIAIWEIFAATKYVNNVTLLAVSILYAFAFPFFRTPSFNFGSKAASLVFIIVLFAIMLKQKTKLEQIGLIFMMTTVISVAFSCLIYLRDLPSEPRLNLCEEDGAFFLVFAVAGAWISDAGAYFVGRFLGRHKMAPYISPHKTWEGAAGGIVANVAGLMLIAYLYSVFYLKDAGHINYIAVAAYGVLCAVAAMLGDLSASYIKRTCNIKDFGNILPGHGGVLDRFDSLLLVAPLLYALLPVLPIVVRNVTL